MHDDVTVAVRRTTWQPLRLGDGVAAAVAVASASQIDTDDRHQLRCIIGYSRLRACGPKLAAKSFSYTFCRDINNLRKINIDINLLFLDQF